MPTLSIAPLPVDDAGRPVIRRLLIANRGEIACRIISTCRKLAVVSIAVYTEEDRDSLHVGEADEAVCLGSIRLSDLSPHQDGPLLIRTALDLRADAIHPGYGYLSENAEFAELVKAAGLRFIGPSAYSISVLGDKRQAKQFLIKEAPSVPLIPGYNGKAQDVASLEAEADRIGFPVLIKAAAGGGGKGMRIVHDRAAFEAELSRAQSEALRSFGSSDCLLEKYIAKGKHIEVQIMGDSAGDVVSLHERECSIQRRHQKIIEESPSPWISPEMRERMTAAATLIGKLLAYEGAGTVEFMVEVTTATFYFLEVNTRIQVEHAITEETTGIDIVALQIYVAAGGLLRDYAALAPVVPQRGHSIECRLCAEDPARGFTPASGLVLRWAPGTDADGNMTDVRIETAIATGSSISVHFDSMIAKMVVWAPDRASAIAKMVRLLRHTQCIGIKSNHLFLQACLLHPAFADVEYSTNFIPDNLDALLRNPHVDDMAEQRRQLSFAPSLLAKLFAADAAAAAAAAGGGGGGGGPFASIKPGFRNQVFDTGSVAADVVVAVDASAAATAAAIAAGEKPAESAKMLITWPFDRAARAGCYTYQLQALPEVEELPAVPKRAAGKDAAAAAAAAAADERDRKKAGLAAAARHFTQCRRRLDAEHLARIPASMVKVASWQRRSRRSADGSRAWTTAELVVEDGGRRRELSLTWEEQGADGGQQQQQVFCFDAGLGTAIEFTRSGMLVYGGALKSAAAAAAGGAEGMLRRYRAPMPCKVLRVAKRRGDKVVKGEVMVVVESMKMETTIVAALDGVFEPRVVEGTAVDADVLLCEIL
ncbi:hypothetical protein MKZ38_010011 [Zalerion maritima]|uniref:Uncharacterized protein n=1 Tax=Zalerion maritima TaxID=339359 RepID=A0AAD5RFV9_9PEZI|nr:hypothetical protein MKZ38_010011 [Zalerion maritima]